MKNDGIILKDNVITRKLHGESLIGRHFSQFFPDVNQGNDFEQWFNNGTVAELSNENTASGFSMSFYFTAIPTDVGLMIVGENDIGDTEKLNRQILLLNGELSTMIRSIIKKNVELEELNRSQNLLLGELAHDLRNPISSIMMRCEYLSEYEAHTLTDDLKQIVLNISKSLVHMLRLIEAMLDLSKIDSEQLQLKRSKVDLNELIHESIQLNRFLAQLKKISILSYWPTVSPV